MAEEWDHLEDWEEWDPTKTSFLVHATAGSMAGAAEHCVMFPFDTIKTHLQTEGSGKKQLRKVIRREGVGRLWRGVSSMLVACVPAHAAYFSIFEQGKLYFGASGQGHTPVAAALSGALATVAHDSIMTPMDVIKQRLQLGLHKGVLDCATTVARTEGIGALFLSFPTTLVMNLPYAGIMAATNESMKTMINPTNEYNLGAFFLSGGVAGSVAAIATNPFDVVKTRLQTQHVLCQVCENNPKGVEQLKRNAVGAATGGGGGGGGARGTGSGTPSRLMPNGALYNSATPSGMHTTSGALLNGAGHISPHVASPPIVAAANVPQNSAAYSTVSARRAVGSSVSAIQEAASGRRHHTPGPAPPPAPENCPKRYRGLSDAMIRIYKEEGASGFWRGVRPRLMVHAPSVAISWTTYETAKEILGPILN